MDKLINEYSQVLYRLKKLKENIDAEEKKIISGMISDLEFSLEWMRTGRRPGNQRGIERRAAYLRERAFDPLLMQRYFRSMNDNLYEWDEHQQEYVVGEWGQSKGRWSSRCSVFGDFRSSIYTRYCLP